MDVTLRKRLGFAFWEQSRLAITFVVRLEGFEPPTLGSVDRCSNPLSYSRIVSGETY